MEPESSGLYFPHNYGWKNVQERGENGDPKQDAVEKVG
jgi:hypothetical protein